MVNAFGTITVIAPSSSTNITGSILLNATTVDTSAVSNLTFRWVNSASAYVYNQTINNTAGLGIFSNSSFDTTLLTDGNYTLFAVPSNDTYPANGTLSGSAINLYVDNTDPTVSISAIPASLVKNTDALSVTYSVNDTNIHTAIVNITDPNGLLIFQNGTISLGVSHSISITAASLNVTGTYTISIFANDSVGNTATASTTINLAAAATTTTTTTTSSSSSSIGPAGLSNSVTGKLKHIWTTISPGIVTELTSKDTELGISKLSFKVVKKTPSVSITIEKITTLPTDVTPLTTTVYKNIKITDTRLQENLDGPVAIEFSVEKTWLDDNKLDSNTITLYRYVNGEWTELTTKVASDDGTLVHFTTETPGFSYFAIAEKQQETIAAEKEVAEAETAKAEAETAKANAATTTKWVVITILVVIVVFVIVRVSKRK